MLTDFLASHDGRSTGLGLGHSKSAFDSVCRGEYHHAFFSIRYMAELLIQAMYVRLRPEESLRWHPSYAKKGAASGEPDPHTAYKALLASMPHDEEANRAMLQRVYDISRETDALGAHPSQEVLIQNMNQDDDRLVLGSRYERHACVAALERGLLVTLRLLDDMLHDDPAATDERLDQLNTLWYERRTALQTYLDEFEDEATP